MPTEIPRRRVRTIAGMVGMVSVALTIGLAAEATKRFKWDAPPNSRRLENPVRRTPAAVDAGRAVYFDKCAQCHGKTGAGDGKTSKTLKVKPRDLSVREIQLQTDGELFWKITQGKRPMPGFKRKLSDDQRWQLVVLVRTFGESDDSDKAAGEPSGADEPSTTNRGE